MTGHIFIYGEIGSAVTVDSVQNQIDPQATEYEIHISSVGGDVYSGYAIYGVLANLNKPKTVIIEGLCASIATLIAQAGDKVVMTTPAEFMIHNPYVQLAGDSEELKQAAEQLDRIKNTIIGVYRKRTGMSDEQLSRMMDDETWMSADEAKRHGFIDEVQDKLKAVAYIDLKNIKMSKEKNKLVEILDKGFAELKAMITGQKNMATVTLQDGRVVIVGTETDIPTPEEMVGASIVLEDGTPLIDGSYVTVDGVEIMVEGGIITSAMIQAPAEAEESPEPSEVDSLKAKVAELEAALTAKDEAVVEAESKIEVQDKTIKKFKASVEKLEAKYNELKNITVGDANPPVIQPQAQISEPEGYDPMAEDLRRYFEGRGITLKK
jgi:ATP-dependent Clp endopeptidase proteolytic subunit ClpP